MFILNCYYYRLYFCTTNINLVNKICVVRLSYVKSYSCTQYQLTYIFPTDLCQVGLRKPIANHLHGSDAKSSTLGDLLSGRCPLSVSVN